MKLPHLRAGAYALLAISLITAVYSGQGLSPTPLATALIAALLLAITSVPRTAPLARQPAVQVGAWVLIAACVLINALH